MQQRYVVTCNLVKYRTFSPPRIKKNKKEKKKYRMLGASIQLINIKGGTKRKYLIKNKYKIYVYETTNLFDMFFFSRNHDPIIFINSADSQNNPSEHFKYLEDVRETTSCP